MFWQFPFLFLKGSKWRWTTSKTWFTDGTRCHECQHFIPKQEQNHLSSNFSTKREEVVFLWKGKIENKKIRTKSHCFLFLPEGFKLFCCGFAKGWTSQECCREYTSAWNEPRQMFHSTGYRRCKYRLVSTSLHYIKAQVVMVRDLRELLILCS